MPPRALIIAIDGPSGAGKGTVARELALRLKYKHVDTGAMYRAVAWQALHDGMSLDDEDAVAALAERAAIHLEPGKVAIDGHDVTVKIRTPAIDHAAAATARLPKVRQVLVERQRKEGERGGVVMEGRDIGTVVFPNADVKVYLDASPEERARRRAADPSHATLGAGASDVAVEMEARDRSDKTRLTSPLKVASDAVEIDTTGMGVDDVVARIMEIVDARRN